MTKAEPNLAHYHSDGARTSAARFGSPKPSGLVVRSSSPHHASSRKNAAMNADLEPSQDAPEAYYKVERQLRAMFSTALKPQRSGASIDVRVYFREKPDGSLWGGLALLGDDGRVVENMPLADPPSLPWLLNVMCELGFAAAPRVRTKSRETTGEEGPD